MKLASIDIGTNSMRLLIADYEGSFKTRKKMVNITRIGKGVDSEGYISKEAMDYNLDALKEFVDIAKGESCEDIYVMGTSALRDSKNKEEFQTEAMKKAGVKVDIITGSDEASLGFYGVVAGLKEQTEILVIDIGGGSTEFVVGDPTAGIQFMKSENVGSVRMTEKFVESDLMTDLEYSAIRNYVKEVIADTMRIIKTHNIKRVIGIGGTATTLSSMVQELDNYDMEKVHGSRVSIEDLKYTIEKLMGLTLEERMKIKGLQPKRADVITAGLIILEVILEKLGMDCIEVSEYDNLEGLIYEKTKCKSS